MKIQAFIQGTADAIRPKKDWPVSPSWPGIAVRRTASLPLAYARPPTSFLLPDRQDVDARHKAGHDEFGWSLSFFL